MLIDSAERDPTIDDAATLRRWQAVCGVLAIALVGTLIALWVTTRPDVPDGVVRAGIGLDEMAIHLPAHPLAAGVPLHLDVTNNGELPHDLIIDGVASTPVLAAGESTRLELGSLMPGVYRVHCDVAGHAEAGMVAELTIADARARYHEHDGDDDH